MQKLSYRPDIEGLRAIAILAVVACHAKLPHFEGGFVGVDIFFVLSGYLITGMLIEEFRLNGKVDLVAFYARRLKRLLPGLALMVLVSAIAATQILAIHEQPLEAQTAIYSLLWVSNIHFALQDLGYFDDPGINLFLHTWSLSVEEQFYLLWPALIIGVCKYRRNILLSLLIVLIGSLVLCVWLSGFSPRWGFYSMPSRGWQFALGGVTWMLVASGRLNSSTMHRLAGFSGLAAILASVVFVSENTIYPSYIALAPSVGAALILLSCSSPVAHTLATKPMQAIGKVSYSWYLWHWPVLVLGNALYLRTDVGFQLLLAAISLMIAVFAYLVVELPIRNSTDLMTHPRKAVLTFIMVMASGSLLANSWKVFSMNDPQSELYAQYEDVRTDRPSPYALGCDTQDQSAVLIPCVFGDQNGDKIVVLMGDSIGMHWFSALEDKYVKLGWRLITLSKSSCPIVDLDSRAPDDCVNWKTEAVRYLSEIKPDIIFIGSSSRYSMTAEQWADGTTRILSHLTATAKKVYVILPTPRLPFDGPTCIARYDWSKDKHLGIEQCRSQAAHERETTAINSITNAAASFDSVTILNLNELVCPDGVCAAHDGNRFVYRDLMHLTDTFVKSISGRVSEVIDQAN